MKTKRIILIQYTLTGALAGYFIFHPLIMLLSYLMTVRSSVLDVTITLDAIDVLLLSFSVNMLPWSLSITVFNAIIGFYYGTRKVETMAREELIENLQKALADVKILSGMLPICAWCKKIRNDEGYWQKIEAYFKSRSDLDFTHSICNECAQKQYPELYQQPEEKKREQKN